ncbi:MAG TPA: sensor histidine kinase, partial [Bacteroidota bacterium]|nr:sensor histidine kinase [Bacteroidota bacterium]
WSGLSRFRNGQWTYWQKGRGLKESRMWTMAVDTSDRVFFSHQYRGLGYIDRYDSVYYLSSEEGLVSHPVEEVDVDQRGWLWVATGNGLVCWNGTDWTRLDSRSGLANDQLWPILPLEHEILVGTQGDGVSILQLSSLNPVPTIVRIGDPAIDDNDASITWQPHAYWGDLPSASLDTRFRLSGSAWSTWSTQHAITFKDLAPGTYRIDVQPKAPFGQKPTMTASRVFEIPPPLFLRPAVAIPLALLLLLVLAMALIGWVRYRSYNRAIRENEVRFRTQYKAFPVPTATFKKTVDAFVLSDCNDAALTLTNHQVAGWLGKTTKEIFADRPPRRGLLDMCYESRATIRKEYRFEHRMLPAPIDVDLTLAFVPPDLVLVHAEDITERKRNEQHLRESREQLRALATRLQSVREEERTTLSREIHDELGQLITGLKMDLSWLRRHVMAAGQGIPEALSQRINQMHAMLDDAIHTVRKIAGQLRPAVLDDLGLVAAIEWQARDFGERTGIRCDVALGIDELQMDRERATELFRIYQELLTNIARHAHASKVRIALTLDDGVLALEVCDNGKGIPPEEIRRPTSLGILGMEERALRIHGMLSIAPGEHNGTVARVEVPLNGGVRG